MTVRLYVLTGAMAVALAGCNAAIGDSSGDSAGVDGGGAPADNGDADAAVVGGDEVDAGQDVPEPTRFEPSNISSELVELGTVPLVFGADDGPYVIETDTGAIRNGLGVDVRPAGVVFTIVPQAGAPSLGVFSASRIEVELGAEVFATGNAALVLATSGNAVIEGEISAAGSVGAAGPGGFAGGVAAAVNGAGPGGGAGESIDFDIGGGGAGHVAVGGAGGARDNDPGAAAGTAYGDETLVPLLGGSGGGAGGGDGGNGIGGGGGGAVQLTSFGAVIIGPDGGINCGGGGGQGGRGDDAGGGGGSGGSVLIEAPQVVVLGALATNGGGGGAGAEKGEDIGADGLSGQLGATPAVGGSGLIFGTDGGHGGATGAAMGQPGATADLPGTDTDNAGGGGGAAGRILLRSVEPAQVPGVVSPAEGTTLLLM